MKTYQELSDSELLQLMMTGEEEALAALYRKRQRAIYLFALQMCGSRALAEDITQEVFMVLIREGNTFDPARGSLSAFLLGVARNHTLRRLHRERFYAPMGEALDHDEATTDKTLSSTGGPLDDLSRNETIESVRKAVLALPERYREVVVLCDLQELSYAETAEVLGCAVGTVRSRLHRARALLIEKLRPVRGEKTNEEKVPETAMKSARCFA